MKWMTAALLLTGGTVFTGGCGSTDQTVGDPLGVSSDGTLATETSSLSICGNGVIEPGETCMSCAADVGSCLPINANSFESASDFSSWTIWNNCATDSSWYVQRFYTLNDNPAPGGGAWALRIHTTGIPAGCVNPGVYALSPFILPGPTNLAGKTVFVQNQSRNGSGAGTVSIHFYNTYDQELGAGFASWNSDAWLFNADPILSAVAPAYTVKLRIRYGMNSANGYADMDLLRVTVSP
ncbi:hypothetical protein [Hyalangium versicolor]|uniref:hypothetical protein n=1 Tax=Hyalangium versicolor TaxID=2861190 RepID=UPI001CCC583F|nr:hypothetical protein [Hyalangium versicolor]